VILSVGTLSLLLANKTSLFTYLGYPMVPFLKLLQIPDADIIASATLAGIAEMYIPALMAKEASEPARFFIAVLSVSQLIFFSSVGPMILDMFKDIPIRIRDLVCIFIIRTFLCSIILALILKVMIMGGIFL
jgi:nucleoside recognition membrane protein YjiH